MFCLGKFGKLQDEKKEKLRNSINNNLRIELKAERTALNKSIKKGTNSIELVPFLVPCISN